MERSAGWQLAPELRAADVSSLSAVARSWFIVDGQLAPNGSRLSCGRLARRRKSSGRKSVPARAQHPVSFRAITARQLQALVRQLRTEAGPHEIGRSSTSDRYHSVPQAQP